MMFQEFYKLKGYTGDLSLLSAKVKVANIEFWQGGKSLYQAEICSQYWISYFILDQPQTVEVYTPEPITLHLDANSVFSVRKNQRHKFHFICGERPRVLTFHYQIVFGIKPHPTLHRFQETEEELVRGFMEQPYTTMPIHQRLYNELALLNDYMSTGTNGDIIKRENQLTNIMISIFQQNCFDRSRSFITSDKFAKQHNAQYVLIRSILEAAFSGKTLEEIADEYHYTPRHIQRLGTLYYGESFTKVVQNFRITHAMRLLNDTDMSLAEIREEIGIPDEKTMSRIFRATTGMSPTEFRKKCRVEQLSSNPKDTDSSRNPDK